MTHKTKGIVLRTVKYGETSIVVTIFTELFGIQTYMVNGVRSTKKTANKASYFQAASILDLVVYHHEQKSIQRIKEVKWDYLYQHVFSDVIKNSIALYVIELLRKCLKQPEQNTALFYFCEDILTQLDMAENRVAANLSLFYTVHLAYFLGFQINDEYTTFNHTLDLVDGNFVSEQPTHPYFIDGERAQITSQLLKVLQPSELVDFNLNREIRARLLVSYIDYFALHIPDFGHLKTLEVLSEVLA